MAVGRTCDAFGEGIVFSEKGHHVYIEASRSYEVLRFQSSSPQPGLLGNAVSSIRRRWFETGIGISTVYAVDIPSKSLIWESAIDSTGANLWVWPAGDRITVLTDCDDLLHLDCETGALLEEEQGVSDYWLCSHGVEVLVRSDGSIDQRRGGTTIRIHEAASQKRILSAGLQGNLLVVFWCEGGAAVYEVATGKEVGTFPSCVWLTDTISDACTGSLVGFGSLNRTGIDGPILADASKGSVYPIAIPSLNQRECCTGVFLDEGRFALLDGEFLWKRQEGKWEKLIVKP